MKSLFLLLFLITLTQSIFADVFFYGSKDGVPAAVNLTDKVANNSDPKSITFGTLDPTAVAVNAAQGSVYISTSAMYQKLDNGSSTNWVPMLIGPSGSGTDECVSRWNGTGSPTLQDSVFCITDLGVGTGLTQLDIQNLRMTGNTLSSTNVNGTVQVTPNGTGMMKVTNSNGSIEFGSTDPFSRRQIWNYMTNASMRLGSLQQDGDPTDVNAEGIVVYGPNSQGTAINSGTGDFGYARIKADRIGLYTSIANVANYYFRADPTSLYLRNDSFTKTFEVTRSNGQIDTALGAGVVHSDASGILSSSAVSLTADVSGILPLANGGTNKNITAADGAIPYLDADSFELLAPTATAGLAFISGANSAPSWYVPTVGSALFAGVGGKLEQDNSKFFWDNTNKKLGIGTNAPSGTLDIFAEEGTTLVPHITLSGNVNEAGTISRNIAGNGGWLALWGGSTATGGGGAYFNGNGVADGGSVQMTLGQATSNYDWFDNTISILLMRMQNNGNLGIGTPYAGTVTHKLEVLGDIFSNNSLKLEDPGVGSNYWTIQSPTLAANYVLTLPVDDGAAGECLKTDGSGVTSWGACSASAVTTVGAIDSQAKSANGLVISGNNIYAQTADATNPGMVSTAAQTLAGQKDFTSAPKLSSLTASRPLKLDALNVITASKIDVTATNDITGLGAAGTIPYSDGTVFAFSAAGTAGQALVSGGVGAPTFYAPTATRCIYAGTSGVLADDAGCTYNAATDIMTLVGGLNAANLSISGNTLSSSDVNGNIVLNPNGTGQVNLPDLTASLPLQTDASKNVVSAAINLSGSQVTSTLGPTNGGTGQSTYTTGDMLYASAANTLSKRAAGTDGQYLQMVSGVPAWVSPPAGSTSYVRVNAVSGTPGRGSTNTTVRYYSNTAESSGTDITYTSSATNGDSFTINTPGVYHIAMADTFSAGAYCAVTKNGTQLSTDPGSLTNSSNIIGYGETGNTTDCSIATVAVLAPGDVIRPQVSTTAGTGTTYKTYFSIAREVGINDAVKTLGYSKITGSTAADGYIPADNTIPQITEGTQIFSMTVTPTRVGAKIHVYINVKAMEETNTGGTIAVALFKDGASDAVAVDANGMQDATTNLNEGRIILDYEYTTVSLTPISFTARIGGNANPTDIVLNESEVHNIPADVDYGNTISSWMKVTEEVY